MAVTLASGAGVESALARSAACSRGWAFTEIGQALVAGRLRGETPWAALDRLGTELGVPELRELAASVALAGEDGARVRASVAARARSLRTRGLTDTEADAQAATERMSLPIVLLMAGFMIFVIYPALSRITTAHLTPPPTGGPSMPELAYLRILISLLRDRLAAQRAEQGSYTTEMVVATAIIVGLTITVGAILVDRVVSKAQSIPLN